MESQKELPRACDTPLLRYLAKCPLKEKLARDVFFGGFELQESVSGE